MKKVTILLAALFILNAVYYQKLSLVRMVKSRCRIIIPENPTSIEEKGASVLRNHISNLAISVICKYKDVEGIYKII